MNPLKVRLLVHPYGLRSMRTKPGYACTSAGYTYFMVVFQCRRKNKIPKKTPVNPVPQVRDYTKPSFSRRHGVHREGALLPSEKQG
jgi:hypothetical protein